MYLLRKYFLFTLFSISVFCAAEDRTRYNEYFERASVEFNVPADVLRGIAFAETRWSHLQWSPGDSANPCNGMPRPYGIMSLWDNQYFGHSLHNAAALLTMDPQVLKDDPFQNIRGAAALLRRYYDSIPKTDGTTPNDIESWAAAVAQYSGIPQPEFSSRHALNIFEQMENGYHGFGIEMKALLLKNLNAVRSYHRKISDRAEQLQRLKKTAVQPDYPGALWSSAYNGHWYTTGYGRYFVVLHDMEGYYLSTISYFQQSATSASIHYCINSGNQSNGRPAGEVTQMVEEQYWAWHVLCWNRYTIGIEHEGFSNDPAWYTDAMYRSSADLVKYLCNKYSIPKDRNHIIAHQEWQNANWQSWVNGTFNPAVTPDMDPTCNTHTDPGVNWQWDYFLSLVNGDSATIGFESVNLPKWYSGPTTSGSTFGVSKLSIFSQSSNSVYRGIYSGKLSVIDSSQSSAWFVRQYFTGDISRTPNGFVRVYLRSTSVPSGLQVRLAFDDNNNTATEVSSWKNITADGAWHMYEWDIDDANQWFGWVGSSNGQLDGPTINFDSFQFQCTDPNSGAVQYDVYIDNLEFGVTSALPIELTSFTAISNGKNIELKWNTATETNNHGFEIEKTVIGNQSSVISWNKIGFVEGSGTSNLPKSYSFVDANASGKVAYRLKQIDNNGNFKYSAIVETNISVAPIAYTLSQNYPNPFNPSTQIDFTVKQTEHATIKIFDTPGHEIATLFNDIAQPGQVYTVQFNASQLASGMYFYVLRTKNFREVKKMSLLK